MLGLPNVDAVLATFRSDVDGMREDLSEIRVLLGRLVALEETNAKGKK
jgi:hypothetical protein